MTPRKTGNKVKDKIYRSIPFSKRQAFRSSISVSLTLNLLLLLGIFYGRSRFLSDLSSDLEGYLLFFTWHFSSNVLLFYLLFLFNFRVIKLKKANHKRVAIIIAGTVIICAFTSPVLSQLQWHLLGMEPGFEMNGFIVFNLVKDIIASIIVLVLTSNIYLNVKREQTAIANQKLREENIRTRFEALKNQLDPHFLFNSLNTLNGLIGMDDEKAHEYLDNLSSVFRYTLHSKTIVHLHQEIEYVDSYISLLKIRFGDNMEVEYDIDERYREYYIMPASLQLLVENAVKHNVISNKSPLVIHIGTTDRDSIIVSNRINPKSEKTSGGVGLANLADRYSILFGNGINISGLDGTFAVEIPLMEELNKKIKI